MYKLSHSTVKNKAVQLENGHKTWSAFSLKEDTYMDDKLSTWKNVQDHYPSEKLNNQGVISLHFYQMVKSFNSDSIKYF